MFFSIILVIRWIQQNKIYKKIRDLTKDWTQIPCLAVIHSNHYTSMFSVLVWDYKWILSMHGWFCQIHLIRWKSLHFRCSELCWAQTFQKSCQPVWLGQWSIKLQWVITGKSSIPRWYRSYLRMQWRVLPDRIQINYLSGFRLLESILYSVW